MTDSVKDLLRSFHWLILMAMVLVVAGCKIKPDQSRYITDPHGRSLVLHGLNTSSSAKSAPNRLPWIEEKDVARAANNWGFNFVRFLIFWDRLEPAPGVYDQQYLAEIAERVRWYAKHNMYVLLDMHQDLYALQFGGDGAPDWATVTDGLPVAVRSPWWLTYLELGVTRAFDNFWDGSGSHSYLQQHYANAWQQVAKYFKDSPNVIGYDLMNEPYGGSSLWPLFEPLKLKPFYDRVISRIRAVDNDTWLFIEPQAFGVNFGVASTLGVIDDPRQGNSRIVYAPHFYPVLVHEGAAYKGNVLAFKSWPDARVKELNKMKVPLVVGEFGISPNQEGALRFVNDVTTMADHMGASWAFWSNDPGSWAPTDGEGKETVLVDGLVRVYPRAVAGQIVSFLYEPNKKEFTLTFNHNPQITAPTEIYIPARRHFPNGWQIEVKQGMSQYMTTDWDAVREVLKVSFESYQLPRQITLKIKTAG
ncbi:glycoside hydrolase family 5 protein [Endozoicomonas sp. SM1973]|uniref:Glycoside hydrolase family 5 protein n=1 Tax=Spartinivicinus marinus TaxID=2994442 RepID=A0A853HZI7_9GAMM|nr:cellulase family glycosylhydrolase [Spartinivicinus marinus]MCX4028604.1 cellulase family glycosylhydrolase [Spartinivicinus marinus]NYZ67130.1 glycoside hydrolase family 5 protein [Spartinivicinus marinus]